MATGNGLSTRTTLIVQALTVFVAVSAFFTANGRVAGLESRVAVEQSTLQALTAQTVMLKHDVRRLQRIKADIIAAIRQVVREHLHHQSYHKPKAQAVAFRRPRFCWGKRITKYGTNGDDIITGTDGPDVIWVGSGDDAVFGDGGNDRICGGRGNDTLVGDPGTDWVSGGPGNDQCVAEHKRTCES